jgi:hypothetical protein
VWPEDLPTALFLQPLPTHHTYVHPLGALCGQKITPTFLDDLPFPPTSPLSLIPNEPISVRYHRVQPISPLPSLPTPIPISILVDVLLRLKPNESPFAYKVPPETMLMTDLVMFAIRANWKLELEMLERLENLEKRFLV